MGRFAAERGNGSGYGVFAAGNQPVSRYGGDQASYTGGGGWMRHGCGIPLIQFLNAPYPALFLLTPAFQLVVLSEMKMATQAAYRSDRPGISSSIDIASIL